MVYIADITIKSRDGNSTIYYNDNRGYGASTTAGNLLTALHNVGVNIAGISLTAGGSPLAPDDTAPGRVFYEADAWVPPLIQHGAIHTFHFTPTLMSISDLEALPDTTGLSMSGNTNLPTIRDELNKYPEIYYATFRDSGNLYTYMGCNNALGDGTNPHEGVYVVETLGRDVYFHFVYFDENTRKRVSTAKTRSLSTDV